MNEGLLVWHRDSCAHGLEVEQQLWQYLLNVLGLDRARSFLTRHGCCSTFHIIRAHAQLLSLDIEGRSECNIIDVRVLAE